MLAGSAGRCSRERTGSDGKARNCVRLSCGEGDLLRGSEGRASELRFDGGCSLGVSRKCDGGLLEGTMGGLIKPFADSLDSSSGEVGPLSGSAGRLSKSRVGSINGACDWTRTDSSGCMDRALMGMTEWSPTLHTAPEAG